MLTYRELLQRSDAPAGSSWGLFGPTDEFGTLNFQTPETVRAAAGLVRRGAVFNLDYAINAFDPPVVRTRQPARHTMFSRNVHHNDDYIDNLYLQSTSQLDGLRHFRSVEHGFYNYAPAERIVSGDPTLGINRMAERGIVGRGVLIDLERHLARSATRLDHRKGEAFPASLVEQAARAQGVTFRSGDILLLRTGWARFYFEEMSADERTAFPDRVTCPGFIQRRESLEFLWDNQFSVAASDNIALEAMPAVADSPFAAPPGTTNPLHTGTMHPWMIALLGLVIGELWQLDALAEDCARDGVWECMVVAKPLNLIGGVGSPANATAIK